ncbi:hypothetical protein EBZ39_12965 [bacterium]|nr:hypothetical protein [bacterium]
MIKNGFSKQIVLALLALSFAQEAGMAGARARALQERQVLSRERLASLRDQSKMASRHHKEVVEPLENFKNRAEMRLKDSKAEKRRIQSARKGLEQLKSQKSSLRAKKSGMDAEAWKTSKATDAQYQNYKAKKSKFAQENRDYLAIRAYPLGQKPKKNDTLKRLEEGLNRDEKRRKQDKIKHKEDLASSVKALDEARMENSRLQTIVARIKRLWPRSGAHKFE